MSFAVHHPSHRPNHRPNHRPHPAVGPGPVARRPPSRPAGRPVGWSVDGFGPVRWHRPGPRRRLLVIVVATLALVVALVVVGHELRRAATHRDYLSTDGWPSVGQGAYAVGDGARHVSPEQRPVPIASVAKVMTAYLVITAFPLADGADGPELTVTRADVVDTERRARLDQSLVAVAEGERLTERQALMALLLPSANNVAIMLARFVSGTVQSFVDRMNATAWALGLSDTTYTDPSGFDERTVSTAADQLRLARVVGRNHTLAAMMATASYPLPVAGVVHNTNGLLGHDGFLGMKTGSLDAAGGCFMFHVRRTVDGRAVDLWGVVLGQPGPNLINAALTAARQLAATVLPTG
jgi:D-alanyl-D-alanine carboxypeptidase (penicillin-binding protein 5/6)